MAAGQRIPREVLLHEIARALRASFPDRAEELLRELEIRLSKNPPLAERVLEAEGHLPGDAPEEVAKALSGLVDSIERRLGGGWRVKWTITAARDPEGGVRAFVKADPAGR